ncbi:MAG: hypothetical protein V7750_13590 [Sneathiella sp.]
MQKSIPPGRPKKTATTLSKDLIFAKALEIIQAQGEKALSFRILAEKLGVSPMAVSYHVGSRREMLQNIIKIAFSSIACDPVGETPEERIKFLLLKYCDLAIEHANLVQCILRDPSLMTEDLVQLTSMIRKETQVLNKGDKQDVMLNLIVDYTHGFMFSAAAAPQDLKLLTTDYKRSLDWVLERSKSV